MTLTLVFVVLIALAALRVPVGLAMFAAGVAGTFWIGGDRAGLLISSTVTGMLSGYVLAAMAFALLLTGLARASGLSRHGFIGWRAMGRPNSGGGLALAMLSLIVGASAGDSLDRNTAVAVRDRLDAAGYRQSSIIGVLFGAAGMRFVVPVSAIVVFAGTLVEQSITQLMLALVIPAGTLAVILLIVAGLSEFYRRAQMPEAQTPPADRGSIGYAFAGVFVSLFLILLVTLLIAWGLATPTEAFGLAALIMLIYAVIVAATGGAGFRDLFQGLVFSARKFGDISLILLGALLIARAAALSGNTQALAGATENNLFIVMAVMLVGLVVCAALLGALPALALSSVVIFPTMMGGGIDATLAVVLLLAAATLGQAIPGIGRTNSFIRQCFDDVTLGQITRAALPYFIATAVWLAVVIQALPMILFFVKSLR